MQGWRAGDGYCDQAVTGTYHIVRDRVPDSTFRPCFFITDKCQGRGQIRELPARAYRRQQGSLHTRLSYLLHPSPRHIRSLWCRMYGGCVHPWSRARLREASTCPQNRSSFFGPRVTRLHRPPPASVTVDVIPRESRKFLMYWITPEVIPGRVLAFYRHEVCTDSAYVHTDQVFCSAINALKSMEREASSYRLFKKSCSKNSSITAKKKFAGIA